MEECEIHTFAMDKRTNNHTQKPGKDVSEAHLEYLSSINTIVKLPVSDITCTFKERPNATSCF